MKLLGFITGTLYLIFEYEELLIIVLGDITIVILMLVEIGNEQHIDKKQKKYEREVLCYDKNIQ